MSHTKGPWYFEETKTWPETNHFWGIYSHNAPTHEVAKVEGMGDEITANANLIAAAPDLLEACEKALEYVDDSDQISLQSFTMNLLKSAIAKARGQE